MQPQTRSTLRFLCDDLTAEILALLEERPRTERDLLEHLEATHSTVHERLRKLQMDLGLVGSEPAPPTGRRGRPTRRWRASDADSRHQRFVAQADDYVRWLQANRQS